MGTQTIHYDSLITLCEHVDEIVIGIDHDQNVCLVNPAAENAFKIAAANIIGQPLTTLPELNIVVPLVERTAKQQVPIREQLTLANGQTQWVQILLLNSSNGAASDGPKTTMMRELVHDLKNPLSSAKSYIDLVENVASLTETQSKFTRKARLRLAAILNQIHQLEDMAWLNEDGQLRLADIDLANVIRRALIHLEGFAQQQQVTITVDLPLDGCPFQADPHRLERTIANLIHNAIKYSPEGGPVTITAEYMDSRVIIRVTDQGIGISSEDLPHVFEKSFRVLSEDTLGIEGSGLGLSMVKTIVEMHGGEVFVDSELGQGSTFGFWLPCPE